MFKKITLLSLATLILFTACSQIFPESALPTASKNPTLLASDVPAQLTSTPATAPAIPLPLTETQAPTNTNAPTATVTPTQTPVPTDTPTATITPTSTPAVLTARVLLWAFCRYGPGKAYLYSAELKKGNVVEVQGKNAAGTWLWVKPANLNRNCWTAKSNVELSGDLNRVHVVRTRLPFATNLYDPPTNVQAYRQGGVVTVTWEPVWMTEDDDRGYLIEASVCQNGTRVDVAVQTYESSADVVDDLSCGGQSSGRIYTVEKHGYTKWEAIPWP